MVFSPFHTFSSQDADVANTPFKLILSGFRVLRALKNVT